MGWRGGQPGDVLVNGLKTHLKKNIVHFSSQAPGPGPGPVPAGPGPAKKDEKSEKGCGGTKNILNIGNIFKK